MSNPFEPPRANLQAPNDAPGSLFKAIAVGALIDIVGSIAVGFVAAIGYGILLGVQGYSEAAITEKFETLEPTSGFAILTYALGMIISGVAGYQCARIANRKNYLAPGILAMISCAFGAALSAGEYSQKALFILSALTVISVLVGASLYLKRMGSGQGITTKNT